MSDRIYAYTVVLEGVYKDEDAKRIQESIEMIKGVRSISPEVADPNTYYAVEKAKAELGQKIIDVIYSKQAT